MAASTSSRVCSSSMFLMKWNGIVESFLIDEVEKLPYFWNPRHPHFTKRLKKNWISADRHEDKRDVAGTRSFLDARISAPTTATKKRNCRLLRSGIGARDLVPKWEHFTHLQFLDDTIKPLDSTSDLDYMELEVNAASLNVSDEDLFENNMELPPIPYSESQRSSHKGQGCLPQNLLCPPQLLEQKKKKATRGLLVTDHVILNHGQVTWTTPELAPPLLTLTPHQREDVSALDRFNVHRCPTRRVFNGIGLQLVARQATIRYLYHSATAAVPVFQSRIYELDVNNKGDSNNEQISV
ncbi:uncharacterized protein TNCV_4207451 [Trichonephila clavipes]|nr:uncharacterized protein TNCV_4207451 [Trichonephila clavipes]